MHDANIERPTDVLASGGMPRLIRLPEVMARVGLKRSSIYQRMAEGRFPKSRSLGPRCTVWVEAEIAAFVAGVIERSYSSS